MAIFRLTQKHFCCALVQSISESLLAQTVEPRTYRHLIKITVLGSKDPINTIYFQQKNKIEIFPYDHFTPTYYGTCTYACITQIFRIIDVIKLQEW